MNALNMIVWEEALSEQAKVEPFVKGFDNGPIVQAEAVYVEVGYHGRGSITNG